MTAKNNILRFHLIFFLSGSHIKFAHFTNQNVPGFHLLTLNSMPKNQFYTLTAAMPILSLKIIRQIEILFMMNMSQPHTLQY